MHFRNGWQIWHLSIVWKYKCQSRFVYHLKRRRFPRKLVKIQHCLFVFFLCPKQLKTNREVQIFWQGFSSTTMLVFHWSYIHKFSSCFYGACCPNIQQIHNHQFFKNFHLQGLIVLVGGQDCWCRYLAWKQFSLFQSLSIKVHRIFQEKFFVTEREKRWPTSPSSLSPAECREGAAWGNCLSLTKPKKKKKRERQFFTFAAAVSISRRQRPPILPQLHLTCTEKDFNYFVKSAPHRF